MKLRRIPDDFRVEEISSFPNSDAGPFSVYRLEKRELGTPEAIDRVLRKWDLRRGQVSYGGLKDTHAVTQQYVTIRQGPRRDLADRNFTLTFVGRAERPFTPQDIGGNRFTIVLRSLTEKELHLAEVALGVVQKAGLPNYFDDQRFGSVGESGEFIAAAWIQGDYERALWLSFAEPNRFDRSQEKEQKRLLREHWGDWKTCKKLLAKSHRRSIVTFLDDRPGDFRGAWARVRQDLRSLYVAALQGHLWNQLLAAWLRRNFSPESLVEVPLKLGNVPFPTERVSVDGVISEVELPLPSARTKLQPGPLRELIDSTLEQLGWTMRELRIKYPRDSFFSKGWRRGLVFAGDLDWTSADDELAPPRKKLTLRFTLPRGSYATILVKCITVAAQSEWDAIGDDPPDV